MSQRLTREEFQKWAEGQPRRHERIAGEPVAMAPERAMHARLKARIWRALDRAIQEAGLNCEAFPDGMTVQIDEDTDYEPDAEVLARKAMAIAADICVYTNDRLTVETLDAA